MLNAKFFEILDENVLNLLYGLNLVVFPFFLKQKNKQTIDLYQIVNGFLYILI